MKRLWFSAALLLLILLSTLGNALYLSSFALELTDLLAQAEERGEGGAWEEALSLTQQAHDRWEAHDAYLHITLRHADIDDIYLYFLQVEEFLERRENGEYSAANAALMGRLDLLREQEELSLKNIL